MEPMPALVVQTLQKENAAAPQFRSLFANLGGHQHTLGGYFLPQPRALRALGNSAPKPEDVVHLKTHDGDLLVGVRHTPVGEPQGVLHVFHGLAGSSNSTYMPRIAETAIRLGLITILWNHRGCGPGRKLAKRPYHSGRSDDLGRAVEYGREYHPHLKQILLGYSLSANAAVLLAAGVIPAQSESPLSASEWKRLANASQPDLCIAVNPPLDLKQSALRLSHGPAKLYGQRFIVDLLECLHDRAGEPEADQALRQLDKHFATFRFSVIDFDAAYTGFAGGFKDHLDYYKRASCGRYLTRSEIPLVVLTSEDDPITRGLSDLERPLSSGPTPNLLALDLQTAGGHMGYIDLGSVRATWDDKQDRWMEERIALYLKSYLKLLAASPERT